VVVARLLVQELKLSLARTSAAPSSHTAPVAWTMLSLPGMAQARDNDGLSALSWISIVLAVIGAINWGLVGLFNFNVVAAVFGTMSAITRVIYVLVGLAGLYLISLAVRLGNRARV
jgi:uncharacterized protein